MNYLDNQYTAGAFVADHPTLGAMFDLADTIPGQVVYAPQGEFLPKPIVTLRDFFESIPHQSSPRLTPVLEQEVG